MDFKGKVLVFVEDCGPIPKNSKGLCIEDNNARQIIRIWLSSSILGVNEFVISKRHIKKIRAI